VTLKDHQGGKLHAVKKNFLLVLLCHSICLDRSWHSRTDCCPLESPQRVKHVANPLKILEKASFFGGLGKHGVKVDESRQRLLCLQRSRYQPVSEAPSVEASSPRVPEPAPETVPVADAAEPVAL
jgi:hypothetical protein